MEKMMISLLLAGCFAVLPVSPARAVGEGAGLTVLASSSDYDVGTSNGTWTNSGGTPPPRKCTTVCSPNYHTCTADCYRGAIETMGGCLAQCRIAYCQDKCE